MTNWIPDIGSRSGPRYVAIANAIADAIESGELRPGMRLPTHRDLAYRLKVSVQTVSSAYNEAERRGLVIGETGRGTYVQLASPETVAGYMMDRRPSDLIDFSVIRPVTGAVHIRKLHEVFTRLASDDRCRAMLACRPVVGLDAHRKAGAMWLRTLGVKARPEDLLITNGATHALLIALSTLTNPGDVVITEGLTEFGVIALASMLHFRLDGLECDSQGIVPEAVDAACASGSIKAICVQPTFANPTMALMPEERRRRLVQIARAHDVWIVEDDPYSVLTEDRPPPLAALAPERTLYITSFSKTVMPGLRTGYLHAPPALVPRLTGRLRGSSWMATPMTAEMATLWLEDGTIPSLIQWQRQTLAARNGIAQRALAGFEYASHEHGLHLWLTLPGRWRSDNFVTEARAHGVAVAPAEPFVVNRFPEPHNVRIALGAPGTDEQCAQGLGRLADILRRAPEPVYFDL